MRNVILAEFEDGHINKDKIHPKFRPGDTVRVHYRIEESAKSAKGENKFRIQVFEGVCIRFCKGRLDASFTVRKMGANGVGVERIFPYHSIYIDQIEIVSSGRVRRSRLYFLRSLLGKAARIKERRMPAGFQTKTIDKNAAPAEPKKKRKKAKDSKKKK